VREGGRRRHMRYRGGLARATTTAIRRSATRVSRGAGS
jgi:hypothetical protein